MARRKTAPGSLKAGDVIGGKYRVERLLGEGGMGMVVAAHHTLLDQPVAVKLLYSDDDEAVSRLIMEAKSCARIPGEHVSRVLDIDRGDDGLPFIVMELLEGVDLYQVLAAQGPLPRWLVVDYMLQALMGLAGAHARGIVHRDLKPSNLFLAKRADGTSIIKVLDFGVSKSIMAGEDSARDQQLTGAKAMLGSPPYMSPEQVRSPKTVDCRADIWAMGIVMYELLTRTLPFRGSEVQETFAMILERDVPRVRDYAPEVPAGMEAAILKCLAKNRDERFQTVGELAKALVPFGSGTWTHAADEIRKTLTRPLPDDTNPSKSRSLPGAPLVPREHDVQPTASTVIGKRKFALSGDGSRAPMLITIAVVCSAALFVLAAVIRGRNREAAIADTPVEVVTMPGAIVTPVPVTTGPSGPEPPPTSVTLPGAAPNSQLTQMGAPANKSSNAIELDSTPITNDTKDAGARAQNVSASPPPQARPWTPPQPRGKRPPQSAAQPAPQSPPQKPANNANGSGAIPSILNDQN